MTRTTTWYRTTLYEITGSTALWAGPGGGSQPFVTGIPAGASILRAMLSVHLKTTVANVSGSGELPVGFDIEDNFIHVGLWTDMYNIGGTGPDPLFSQSDPGWLMQGHMQWEGPSVITHGGLVQELNYNWRLSREFKWDVERSAGPVPIGQSAKVNFGWHNYTAAGGGCWNYNVGGTSVETGGSVFVQVLVRNPPP